VRIEINTDDCMSSGKCVADYPDAFDFDDEELAVLKNDGSALTDEQMLRAARNCPSRALLLFDDDGNQVPT
jgi:ferredoxin